MGFFTVMPLSPFALTITIVGAGQMVWRACGGLGRLTYAIRTAPIGFLKTKMTNARWIVFTYYAAYVVDWGFFLTVAFGVYYALKTRIGKKKQYEKIADLNTSTALEWISISLRTGALIGGFVDLGFSLLPRDVALPSMIASLIKSLADLFEEETPRSTAAAWNAEGQNFVRPHPDDCDDCKAGHCARRDHQKVYEDWSEEMHEKYPRYFSSSSSSKGKAKESDDEDEYDLCEKYFRIVSKLRHKITEVWIQYRHRISLVVFASVCGLVLYLLVHKRQLLLKYIRHVPSEGNSDKGSPHTSLTVDTNKQPETPLMLISGATAGSEEAKGKNKGRAKGRNGRRDYKARGVTRKKTNTRNKRSDYVLYDDDRITDMMIDGEYVTPSDYFGDVLPVGHYIITRDFGTHMEDEEFTIVAPGQEVDNEFIDEPIPSYSIACPCCSLNFPMNDDKQKQKYSTHVKHCCPFCLENDRNHKPTCDGPKQTAPVKKEQPESLNSTKPKVDLQIRQYTCELLDVNKRPILNGLVTKAGILTNRHGLAQIRWLRQGVHEFQLQMVGDEPKLKSFSKVHHGDLICLPLVDGLCACSPKQFDIPTVGQTIAVHSYLHTSVATGVISEITDGDIVHDASTSEGDCGAPYVNVNGKIVGLHYAGSPKGRIKNLGIAITDDLRQDLGRMCNAKN